MKNEIIFRMIDQNGEVIFDSSKNDLKELIFPGSKQLRRNTVIRVGANAFVINEVYVQNDGKFIIEVVA